MALGQRRVPPLAPGTISKAENQLFSLPASLPVGQIGLFACSDANNQVAEYRDDTNCSRGQAWPPAGAVPALASSAQPPVGMVNTPSEGRWSENGGWAPSRFSGVGGEVPPGLVLAETGAIAGKVNQLAQGRSRVPQGRSAEAARNGAPTGGASPG